MNKLFVMGFLMLFPLLFSACGRGDGRVQIELYSQKPEMRETVERIIRMFEAENPDIQVLYSSGDIPALRTRVAVGETPSIINIHPGADFLQWSRDGRFFDFTGHSILNRFTPGAAYSYAVDGRVFALPYTWNATGIFYNATAFNALGLTPPNTWAEMETLVQSINNDGRHSAFSLALSTPTSWTLMGTHHLMWLTVTGGGNADAMQQYLFHSPINAIRADSPVVQAVTRRLGFLADNAQPNALGASYPDQITAFASGTSLMMPQGIWALPMVNQQRPNFEISMFPFPVANPGDPHITAGAPDWIMVVSSELTEEQHDAAIRFLEFMARPDIMQIYFDVDGSPTSVLGVQTAGRFMETESMRRLIEQGRHILWPHMIWPAGMEFFNAGMDYAMTRDFERYVNDLNRIFNEWK